MVRAADTTEVADQLELFFAALALPNAISSVSMKIRKVGSSRMKGFSAQREMKRSSERRRPSMNSGEKRFITAFSGNGGTTTPGRFSLSVERNHSKSEYRRITEKRFESNEASVVSVFTLYDTKDFTTPARENKPIKQHLKNRKKSD